MPPTRSSRPRSPSSTRWRTCARRSAPTCRTSAAGSGSTAAIGAKFLHAGPGLWRQLLSQGYAGAAQDRRGLRQPDPDRRGGGQGERQPASARWAARWSMRSGGDARGKKVAMLGLTFKPNTDDMRDSPSIAIALTLDRCRGASGRLRSRGDGTGQAADARCRDGRQPLRGDRGRRRDRDGDRMGRVPRARPRAGEGDRQRAGAGRSAQRLRSGRTARGGLYLCQRREGLARRPVRQWTSCPMWSCSRCTCSGNLLPAFGPPTADAHRPVRAGIRSMPVWAIVPIAVAGRRERALPARHAFRMRGQPRSERRCAATSIPVARRLSATARAASPRSPCCPLAGAIGPVVRSRRTWPEYGFLPFHGRLLLGRLVSYSIYAASAKGIQQTFARRRAARRR